MNPSSARWMTAAACSAILFGILMQVPHFLYQHDARYRGVPLHFNSDEQLYLARVEEAISGRPELSDQAFVSDPSVRGSQPAILERMIGTMFQGSGMHAADALQIMDSVGVMLIFMLLFWFFLQCRFSPVSALLGTAAFCLIELYNLQRPIHQGLSLVLVLLALNFLIAGIERWKWWGVLGGVFFGLLFADYFWSWSFGALWVGVAFAMLLFAWMHADLPRIGARKIRLLGIFCALGVVIALPFLWQLFSLIHMHPLGPEVTYRSGLHDARLPESIPYFILFGVMVAAVASAAVAFPDRLARHRYALVTILAAFIASHQQMIHGKTFFFVSHYLFVMAIAAICMVLVALSVRRMQAYVGAAAACVYLLALAWDGRYAIDHFRVVDRFQQQYFAPAIAELRLLPRATILGDAQTSMLIAETTVHDVVYTPYLKNVMLGDVDIASRYCLTVAPLAPEDRKIESDMIIWPDANTVQPKQTGDPSSRIRELSLVRAACAQVDRVPAQWIRRYGVAYILWDEKSHPEWRLSNLHVPLQKFAKGNGWSLWKIPETSVQKPAN